MKIGVSGIGFVGKAIKKSFEQKGVNVVCYDKYISEYNGTEKRNSLLMCDIIYLSLPTCFSYNLNEYDKEAIHENCIFLQNNNFKGLVIIKSTVEPETTNKLCDLYRTLKLIHNPEFLTASTAYEDFHNQTHIVIGRSKNVHDNDILVLKNFYETYYPDAELSVCSSVESESMKLFCNCFYSVKIQFFNELYMACKTNGSDYNVIRDLMIKNRWINPMHTMVPGTDGKLSYGGYCFPKDTNALLMYMKSNNIPHAVLESTIQERNTMREDSINTLI